MYRGSRPAATMLSSTALSSGQPVATRDAMSNITPSNMTTSSTTASSEAAIPSTNHGQPKTSHPHIWLVTGPAGCGKSTVGEYLAKEMKLPFIEGDNFHPKANVEKMRQGIPLDDADRWDWLTCLREEALHQLSAGHQGVVLTCSALKKKYRDVIRVIPYKLPGAKVHFVYLHAPEETLMQRVQARQGHYMPASMVHSQFEALEPPMEDEKDVISVDVSVPVREVEERALQLVREAVEQELRRDS